MKLGEIISKAKVVKCRDKELPVLSITLRDGFVFQSSHFKKEIASKDKSNYNIVKRNQLVQSIHIDEGGFSVQQIIDEGIVSPAYRVWDVDTSIVNPDYLNTFLRSKPSIAYYKSKLRGTIHRRGKIDDADILGMNIPVPTLVEQEKIVAELDCLTGIVEKKKQQLEELDNLAQSIFYDMFGDPITNEKGWKKMLLGEICTPKKSIARASKTYKANETIHYIDIASIDNSQALLTGTTPFVFAEAPSRAQQKVEKGDVLISLVRPNLRNIAMVEYDDSLLVASSGFCVLRAKDSNPRFIKAFALTDGFTRYLTDRTAGANYPAVREEDIRACSLGVPPLDRQSEFAQKVEAIEKQKELVKRSIVETETLFNSRMDFWFNN